MWQTHLARVHGRDARATTSLIRRWFRSQSLHVRAPGFLFQSAILRTAGKARGNPLCRSVIQARNSGAELFQTQHLITMLAAFLLSSDDDAGRQMPEPHGAFGFVDVLAARAARAKGIDLAFPQQVFV
jgi:hypothetical protein